MDEAWHGAPACNAAALFRYRGCRVVFSNLFGSYMANRSKLVFLRFVFLLGLFALGMTLGCGGAHVQRLDAEGPVEKPVSFDHGAFDRLLQTHVDEQGRVDYAGLQADAETALHPYLRQLARTNPSGLSPQAQLAFWLNAYNAYTLKLVGDHYPVESIKDIKPLPLPGVPFVNSPFTIRFAEVGGRTYTLDHIEHNIIRRDFDEPRIHFALVCAARSCPPLRREAYTGARLDEQLDAQARAFLHDPGKNIVAEDGPLRLSRIFNWFANDFGENEAQRKAFLAPYFDGAVRARLERGEGEIEYVGYDWSLNDRTE